MTIQSCLYWTDNGRVGSYPFLNAFYKHCKLYYPCQHLNDCCLIFPGLFDRVENKKNCKLALATVHVMYDMRCTVIALNTALYYSFIIDKQPFITFTYLWCVVRGNHYFSDILQFVWSYNYSLLCAGYFCHILRGNLISSSLYIYYITGTLVLTFFL